MQNIQLKNWKPTTALLTVGVLALLFTTGAVRPPKGPSDIPLCVTIEPFGLVASDGLGEYRNGEKGVTALFTAGKGRFSFDTGTRRKAYVDLGVTGFGAGYHRIHFLVSRDQQDPNVNTNPDPNWHDLDLDQLFIGESTPVGLLFFVITKNEGDWVVGFGDYPQPTAVNNWPCGASTPAVVTRLDASTWIIEADAAEDHCLHWGYDYQGRILFPFKMTLRLK